ncbi:MAG: NDP-sugar synthase, partial [Ilumatobacteraceae bacterium]
GVTEVTLALGFKPEPFVDAFPDGSCAGVELRYAVEPAPLDTAGAIRFAAEASGIDETFVVANGDVLTDLDVAKLVDFHRSVGAEATMHLISVDDPSAFGVAAVDSLGRVERFVEKPPPGTAPSNLINAGTYVLEPSVLARIPLGVKTSIERVTFPAMTASRGLFALATDDYWIDTGRPEAFLAANLDVLAGRRLHDTCEAVHPTAQVHPSAVITDSLVGADVFVGHGAVVTGSVLMAGAEVQAGAQISGCLVMGVVGSDAVVTNSVLGRYAVVAAGEHCVDVRRPEP